jgi:hypothetical protein
MIMRRSVWVAVAVALLAVAVGGAIASYAYRAGVAQGLVDAGKLPAVAGPYGYYPLWHGPFFFGGPFFFLLVLFLVFGVFRRACWPGRWSHVHGPQGTGVPPRFEEWHRRAHESLDRDASRV